MDEREHIIREVIKVLPELARALNREVASHAAAVREMTRGKERPALSAAQLRTLIHLAQYGPQTMGELAKGLQITMASATGLVKPLAQLGFVVRSRDNRDERVVRVGLSDEAQGMADQILAHWRQQVEEALSDLDDEDCRRFLEVLGKLAGRKGGAE